MKDINRTPSAREFNSIARENMREPRTCSFFARTEKGAQVFRYGVDTDHLYVDVIEALSSWRGDTLQSASGEIRELYSAVITINNPKEGIVAANGRAMNPAFAVAETLWNISADTTGWLASYNRLYGKYFSDGRLTQGYGNRIFNWRGLNQFEQVAKMLEKNPDTQRALITIFDPAEDLFLPEEKPFSPCIVNLHFKIRRGRLHLRTCMRAQDMWKGFVYDLHLLLTLFQMMSKRLGVEMGRYEHNCDVVRLYKKDFRQAGETTYRIRSQRAGTIDLDDDFRYEDYRRYAGMARDIDQVSFDTDLPLSDYWRNALKACKAYRLCKQGLNEEALALAQSITNVYGILFNLWYDHWHADSPRNAP